jgi:hypothetical protein
MIDGVEYHGDIEAFHHPYIRKMADKTRKVIDFIKKRGILERK